MKRKIYQLLVLLITPITIFGQPVLNSPELYNSNGMVVKRVFCEPVIPGPAGPNQTWDFSVLTETGDSMIQYIMPAIPGNPFPSANLAFYSDDMYVHYEQTSTETLQWGMVDSSGNDENMVYTDPRLVIRRPLTYGDTATDLYESISSVNGGIPVYASGDLSLVADAYGTIHLPHDTFDNVVRIRVEHNDIDSIDGVGSLIIHNIFYVWYSDEAASPVFRVDSISVSGLASAELVDVQYLAQETEVTSIPNIQPSQKLQFSGYLSAGSLMLNGSFENDQRYELNLFGADGQQILKSSFVGSGPKVEIDINQEVANGTYILIVRRKGDVGSMNVIKLIKQ